jgi:hypothetical protein
MILLLCIQGSASTFTRNVNKFAMCVYHHIHAQHGSLSTYTIIEIQKSKADVNFKVNFIYKKVDQELVLQIYPPILINNEK